MRGLYDANGFRTEINAQEHAARFRDAASVCAEQIVDRPFEFREDNGLYALPRELELP